MDWGPRSYGLEEGGEPLQKIKEWRGGMEKRN